MEIDREDLRRAVGEDVDDFTITAIDPELRLHSVTGGVYRVAGDGFSLVIKVVRRGDDDDPGALWVSGSTPAHRNYWKREWLAFDSGLLDHLPGQLRAPRTLLTTERGPDEAWIWMEDIEGRPGASWPVGDYDSAAFDLGTTQGAWAAGATPVPDDEWLSRDWLRGWVDALARYVPLLDDDTAWTGESALFATFRDRYARLWEARDDLFAVIDSAPSCVVHYDFWPTNLIAADDGTTVAIDWSQIGIGSIGQDLDQLTLDPVWMQVLPDGDLDALESHVLAAYLAGLRFAGLAVSEDDLHRWYAASAATRYAPLLGMSVDRMRDPEQIAALEARFGQPVAAINADKARVIDRALTLGERVLAS